MAKADKLMALGINPFPADSKKTHTNEQFLTAFESLGAEQPVTLGGRIMSIRAHGKSAFIDLNDGSIFYEKKLTEEADKVVEDGQVKEGAQAETIVPINKVQIFFSEDQVGADQFKLFFETIDESDFVEFTGTAYLNKRGNKTLAATTWRILSKSLRPMPDAWFGIKDEDERYRKRYIDILLDPELSRLVRQRSIFWNTARSFLLEREYIEVETPTLETTTGGAEARPFVTKHNALDIDVFLRISAGELWQKRLLVAGLPKVFEIGRIFRNEGMSAEHLQDYTQLEFYEAYSDFEKGMKMVQELYKKIALATFGTTKFSHKGLSFDLRDEWKIFDFVGLIKEHYDIDVLATGDAEAAKTLEQIVAALKKNEIDFDPKTINVERGTDLLWKKIRKAIAGPGFLINIPVYLEPLAKKSRKDPRVVERFQIILAGSEVGKGFSELNDPIDQAERFAHQQELRDAGDDEAQMADGEYVEAMEYGMPPAFGFGVSERLFSFLAGKSIRESQIFPLMRPRQ